MNNTLIIFTIINLIYVILNVLKSVFLINTKSKLANALISSITYGYYAIVVKMIASNSFIVGVIGTLLSNFIGTVIALCINDKVLTSNNNICYKISTSNITIKRHIEQFCIINNYSYNIVEKYNKNKKYYCFSLYTKNKDKKVKELLTNKIKNVKWHIENA